MGLEIWQGSSLARVWILKIQGGGSIPPPAFKETD